MLGSRGCATFACQLTPLAIYLVKCAKQLVFPVRRPATSPSHCGDHRAAYTYEISFPHSHLGRH